jgi:tetratricopeptide (TPR) repeat protein
MVTSDMPARSTLVLWLLLGAVTAAAADDAGVGGIGGVDGPILQQLDVVPIGNGARVAVRFGCPLRYTSHFPSKAVIELRISLAPLPGCIRTDLEASGLRAAAGNAAGLTDVRLEPAGSALVLTLAFAAVVDVSIRPAPDFLGLEVAVAGGSPVAATRPGVRKTPVPGSIAPTPAATRPLPAAPVLEAQWAAARAAFDQADYSTAVRQLTRLIEYPEHAHRAEAQELLGLARERSGQLAHAKAEYEEYLRRYPEGAAAGRVSQRHAALTTLDSHQQVEAVAQRDGGMVWTSFGGWAQDYRRDSTSIEAADFSTDFLSQSTIISDADFALRGRGERFDVQTRLNGGYMYDLLPDGPGDQVRISLAYAELADRKYSIGARMGRQSKHTGGVLGTFDGLALGWQALPGIKLNLMSGYPVESTRESFSTDRQFVSLSANWSGWIDGLEISPFLISQTYNGMGDRQAIGGEVRWYAPGRTVVGMLDYDIDYSALNMVLLLGTFQLPGRWTVTGTLDHRKSPFLTTRNALAGQPVQSIDELVALFGEAAVRALAADRTAEADTVSLGVSRPLGERFQWSVDLMGTQFSGMPASGGIPEIPGTGLDLSLGAQLIGTSLISAGDMTIFGLRRYQGSTTTTTSLSVSSRFPLRSGFRVAPRLRFDQREFDADGSTQLLASPSLRLDWNWKRTTIEFEAGGEFANRDRPLEQEKTSRYWLNLGYRIGF